MFIEPLIQEQWVSPFQIVSSFRIVHKPKKHFCRFCFLNKKHCPPGSKDHRRELERIRRLDPEYRTRKAANQARYRLSPEHKAREKIYDYFYNRKRNENKPGFVERRSNRLVKKVQHNEAKRIRQIERESRKIKRLQREAKRDQRKRLNALLPFAERRKNKPAELRGLNALDYPHMSTEQRQAWNKWQRYVYVERMNERARRWRRLNPEKKAAANKRWSQTNPERLKLYRSNPKRKIIQNAYNRIQHLCDGIKIESSGLLRGCSAAFFYKHMEAQFYSGMTWENYGVVWELDHVRPVSSFDLSIALD